MTADKVNELAKFVISVRNTIGASNVVENFRAYLRYFSLFNVNLSEVALSYAYKGADEEKLKDILMNRSDAELIRFFNENL